jgi:hypothetical protein
MGGTGGINMGLGMGGMHIAWAAPFKAKARGQGQQGVGYMGGMAGMGMGGHGFLTNH